MKNMNQLTCVGATLTFFVCGILYAQDIDPPIIVFRYGGDTTSVAGFDYYGPAEWLASKAQSKTLAKHIAEAEEITLQQHQISIGEVKFIASLRYLAHLELGCFPETVNVTTEMVREISNAESLGFLSFNVSDSKDTRWEWLKNLQNLESLEIAGDVRLRTSDLNGLSSLLSLRTLTLEGLQQGSGVKWLLPLKRLVVIEIVSEKIDDQFDEIIASKKSLEAVRLAGTTFDSSSITNLCRNSGKTLRSLSIEVDTAAIFLNFTNLPVLEHLQVDFGRQKHHFDTSVLVKVLKRIPRLRSFRIRGDFDKAAIESIRNSLPKISVSAELSTQRLKVKGGGN